VVEVLGPMSGGRNLAGALRLAGAFLAHPLQTAAELKGTPERCAGRRFARGYRDGASGTSASAGVDDDNPLRRYFDANLEGRGIWKWTHYFEIYHRHLSGFVGSSPKLMEIGVFSGGSLGMWREYFGEGCRIIGVDLERACEAYAGPGVEIRIGDQEDRSFWRGLAQDLNGLDVVIDDGGHTPEQQLVTLEEVLPALNPGGVYICEDIHGATNRFASYVYGIAAELNTMRPTSSEELDSGIDGITRHVHSVHCYPYLVVVEKRSATCERLHAPRHGTEWQPFYDP